MRISWKHFLAALPVLATVLPARPAHADDGRPLVFSAEGPGDGHGAVGLGGRVFLPVFADPVVPVPLFELDYVRGLGTTFDYELHVDTLLFVTYAETGIRARIVRAGSFSLALRGDATILLLLAGGSSGAAAGVLGVTPGVLLSIGEQTQLTLGLDVPMFFGEAVSGFGSATGFGYTLRPNLGVEFQVGERTNLFVNGQLYLSVPGTLSGEAPGLAVFPAVAVGAAF